MAVTVKARARGLLRTTKDLLGEKALPKDVRAALERLDGALKRTWADLESEAVGSEIADGEPVDNDQAGADPVTEAASFPTTGTLREARNVGQWFEAEIHRAFTMLADGQFGEGQLTREERIALSSCIGDALDAFSQKLGQLAPQLYERDPYEQVPLPPIQPNAAGVMGEAVPDDGTALAEALSGDVVPLVERAVRQDGTARMRLIKPGWGTSGYYSADVLRRDGPQVFKAGTLQFVDHPTMAEESDRPERSLKDLGAVLVSDARWEDDPVSGPGLYAQAKVFSDFRPVLEELAPYIGASIRTDGRVRMGEAEGRQGRIVEQIMATPSTSVDFVTRAGAGGGVMELYEAARLAGRRAAAPAVVQNDRGGMEMDEQEMKGLREAKDSAEAQVARLQEALMLREARDVATDELAKMELPEPTRNRLLETLSKKPTLVDGKLDRAAFATQVREAATAELAYLAEASGAGRITGMGSTEGRELRAEDVEKRLTGAFLELGLSESLAKKAAKGR